MGTDGSNPALSSSESGELPRLIENGFVQIPESAPWLAGYLHEMTVFPNGKHDDQVDSTRLVQEAFPRPERLRALPPGCRSGCAAPPLLSVRSILIATPGTTTEHADAVRRDVGTTVRFRPEEVAGAATVATMPVDFAIAEAHSARLLLRLREPS